MEGTSLEKGEGKDREQGILSGTAMAVTASNRCDSDYLNCGHGIAQEKGLAILYLLISGFALLSLGESS